MYTGMENEGETMTEIRKSLLSVPAGILGLAALGLIGLIIPARNYPHPSRKTREIGGFNLPDDLPEPVSRHFLAVLGINPPQMNSAVIWGRGRFKSLGLWLPMRFRCHFKNGHNYLKEMQITWFGFPIHSKVQAYKGHTASSQIRDLTSSYPSSDNTGQDNLLSLWAESMWMPSLLITDQSVQWDTIDESTAWLIVSRNGNHEPILTRFNPNNGLIEEIIALRCRKAGGEKVNWRVTYSHWRPFHRLLLPAKIITSWDDSGAYTILNAQGVEYNPQVYEKES
jgi:hypothetical protein